MSASWREVTLGDFVTLQRGHDLTESDRRMGHVPVMGSAGQNGFHDTAIAKGPGVVIGRSGASFGQVHYSQADFWPHNTVLYVTDFKGNDERFTYYFLKAINFERYNSGSAQASLNRNFIYPIPVRVPPLGEQKAIAAVLGALDEKIELNRRMNTTLEAIARALFQSWFVDFDPVRANFDGRQPIGVNRATAVLFPNEFEDSELGPIPKGWEARRLSDFAEIVKGRSYRSEELADSKTALVTLKSFLRGGGYRADGLKPFIGEYKPNQEVRPGELVVAFTDVTQAADVIGKPALVQTDKGFDTFVASLDVGIVRSKSKHISVPFLYCLFMTAEFQAHTYSHSTGTTVLHLSTAAILSFVSVIPSSEVAEEFAKRAEPIFRLIDENAKQSRSLSSVRDALLPELLSGDVRIAALP